MASLLQNPTLDPSSRVILQGLNGDVAVPILACGTWSWGDATWDYDAQKDMPGIQEVWSTLLENNLSFLDTAEVYGSGESERVIGRLLKESGAEASKVIIATKWLPLPIMTWRKWPRGIVACLKESLARLGVESCDLYQVHCAWTFAYSMNTVAKGLAECVKLGLCKTVGVSNYSKDQMIAMYDALAKEGVPLASNQIEYNLLRRLPETSGLIQAAHERNIVPLAYSPIGQGRLSGKYSVANPPSSKRRFSAYPMEEIEPLLEVMKGISEAHSVPMTAVALNWVLSKGAVPLCGARNGEQAAQNLKCLGWKLTTDEVALLDGKSKDGKLSFFQSG